MIFWFEWIHGNNIYRKQTISHIRKNVSRFPILSTFDLLFRLNSTRYLSWNNHKLVDWKNLGELIQRDHLYTNWNWFENWFFSWNKLNFEVSDDLSNRNHKINGTFQRCLLRLLVLIKSNLKTFKDLELNDQTYSLVEKAVYIASTHTRFLLIKINVSDFE